MFGSREYEVWISDTGSYGSVLGLTNAITGLATESAVKRLRGGASPVIDGFVPHQSRKFIQQALSGEVSLKDGGKPYLSVEIDGEKAQIPIGGITQNWWVDHRHEEILQREGAWKETTDERNGNRLAGRLKKYLIRHIVGASVEETEEVMSLVPGLSDIPLIGFWLDSRVNYYASYHLRIGLSMLDFANDVANRRVDSLGGGCLPIDTGRKLEQVRTEMSLNDSDFVAGFRRLAQVCDYRLVHVTLEDLGQINRNGADARILRYVTESFKQSNRQKSRFILQFGEGVSDLVSATMATVNGLEKSYKESLGSQFRGM
jgi:hypothetical protein